MDKLLMHVYRMDHTDGSARKYWCWAHLPDGSLVTRYAGHGKTLRESITKKDGHTVARQKEREGYRSMGQFVVDSHIHWNSPTAETAPPAQPAASKFESGIMHWACMNLPSDWKEQVKTALGGSIDISLHDEGDELRIFALAKSIKLRGNKLVNSGTITAGDGDWMAGAILLRLAKFLPIKVVDDLGVQLSERGMKAMFDQMGYLIEEEFQTFSLEIGLTGPVSEASKKARARFF